MEGMGFDFRIYVGYRSASHDRPEEWTARCIDQVPAVDSLGNVRYTAPLEGVKASTREGAIEAIKKSIWDRLVDIERVGVTLEQLQLDVDIDVYSRPTTTREQVLDEAIAAVGYFANRRLVEADECCIEMVETCVAALQRLKDGR
jgi:hypothetical protein